MMKNILLPAAYIYLSTLVSAVTAYQSVGPNKSSSSTAGSRRAFLSNFAKTASAVASVGVGVGGNPSRAIAATEGEENVYFGAGCFWHVQHEFVLAERNLLGRKDNELTSLTGYAGGLKTDGEGRVCYHNFQSIADYGKMGHGEVVGMRIPTSSIGDFSVEYFKLFGDKGERADPMDKGGEYRSLLGLPGGRNHPMFGQVETAAKDRGMTLVDGKGNDPDTLGKRQVFVYDSNKYPFYQAEVYHQYHNDFLTPAYGKQYNELVNAALDDGRVKITGCPDRVHQLKTTIKKNETVILGSIGLVTVCLILFGCYIIFTKPKFLYMPIYENYEKDSDSTYSYEDQHDDLETEMVDSPQRE